MVLHSIILAFSNSHKYLELILSVCLSFYVNYSLLSFHFISAPIEDSQKSYFASEFYHINQCDKIPCYLANGNLFYPVSLEQVLKGFVPYRSGFCKGASWLACLPAYQTVFLPVLPSLPLPFLSFPFPSLPILPSPPSFPLIFLPS